METLAKCLQPMVDDLVLQAAPTYLTMDADTAEVLLESDEGTANPDGWTVKILPEEGK